MADVDAMLMEEMKDEGIEEGVIPQYADTDYAGDGDDEEDAYIDVDGVMVQERARRPPPEPGYRASGNGEFQPRRNPETAWRNW